jgi:NADH-quinone oxidoreductase subunit I
MITQNPHQKPLTFFGWFANVYNSVVAVSKGMWITFKHVWAVKPVTIEYPEVKEVLPDTNRSRLFNDAENCISCTQCALACPVDCIYLASQPYDKDHETQKTTSGHPIKLELTQFTIDTALCCYCGLCTVVCPTECLTHSNEYEYSSYEVDQMKYDYMSPEVAEWRDHIVK